MKTLPALCLLLSLCASGQQALNQEKPACFEPIRWSKQSPNAYSFWPPKEAIPTWRVPFGLAYICFGLFVCRRGKGLTCWLLGLACGVLGMLFVLGGYEDSHSTDEHDSSQVSLRGVDEPVWVWLKDPEVGGSK